MKWAYARVQGQTSGRSFWHCPMAVEFARPEFTTQEWAAHAKGDQSLADAFGRDRNKLIERFIENG